MPSARSGNSLFRPEGMGPPATTLPLLQSSPDCHELLGRQLRHTSFMEMSEESWCGTPPKSPLSLDGSGRDALRRTRFKTSCLACQKAKAKCQKEGEENCIRCVRRGVSCIWDEVVLPAKTDRQTARKVESLERRLAKVIALSVTK